MDRLEKFSREASWYAEVEANRSILWAQLLQNLNSIVRELTTATASLPIVATARMADWAFVAATIGDAIGQGDAARVALEAAEIDKAHFLLEADDIYELLAAVADDKPNFEWKAGELFAEVKRRADAADMEFDIKSPKSLGRILHRLGPALKLMIRFEVRTNRHEGQSFYLLGPLPKDGE